MCHYNNSRTGKKFDVTYHPIEEFEAMIAANPSSFTKNFHLQYAAEYARPESVRRRLDWQEANLNELCPEVKPMGLEEFLRTWWGKMDA